MVQLFSAHLLQPMREFIQGRGQLKLFVPMSSAKLSCNDICPSEELFSLRLNVYVPNTCSSVFVLRFLNQKCLDLNQNIGKEPLRGEKPGCV